MTPIYIDLNTLNAYKAFDKWLIDKEIKLYDVDGRFVLHLLCNYSDYTQALILPPYVKNIICSYLDIPLTGTFSFNEKLAILRKNSLIEPFRNSKTIFYVSFELLEKFREVKQQFLKVQNESFFSTDEIGKFFMNELKTANKTIEDLQLELEQADRELKQMEQNLGEYDIEAIRMADENARLREKNMSLEIGVQNQKNKEKKKNDNNKTKKKKKNKK